jgi:hypothetical protein
MIWSRPDSDFVVDTAKMFFTLHISGKAREDFLLLSKKKKGVSRPNKNS